MAHQRRTRRLPRRGRRDGAAESLAREEQEHFENLEAITGALAMLKGMGLTSVHDAGIGIGWYAGSLGSAL